MPLLIFAFLAPAILKPWLTHTLYQAAFTWEEEQIQVDNAAIELGENDRDVLRGLFRANQRLTALEVAHDPAHLCALSPTPAAASCRAADRTLEQLIHLTRETARVVAHALWSKNWIRAVSRGVQINDRPHRLDLVEKRCPICHLSIHWEIRPSQLPLTAHLSRRAPYEVETFVRMHGRSLRKGQWDYGLKPTRREVK